MTDHTLDQNLIIIDHHIKRDVVKYLLTVPYARYSELRPKNIESNLFMYHLSQLVKQGLVEKTAKGYELTPYGKQIADRVSLESLKFRIQPKLITILTVQKPNGEWALIERTHQPFLNYCGFPSGKIHYGESLQESAEREMLEKTGLTGIELTLRGTYIMRYFSDKKVINHIVGYVFSGVAPKSATTNAKTDMFNSFWGSNDDLYKENSFKGHKEIINLLKKHKAGELFLSQDDFLSDF